MGIINCTVHTEFDVIEHLSSGPQKSGFYMRVFEENVRLKKIKEQVD